MSAWAATPNDNNRSNLQKFFHNVEGYGRLGYSIGGTAPMGMPAEIRKLNKFILQPNVSFGADLIKPASQHWGVLAGIHFENKVVMKDLVQVRDYIEFITLALDYRTIRVRDVRELFSVFQKKLIQLKNFV